MNAYEAWANEFPTGAKISIKVPGRTKAGDPGFSGMCHGAAAGGCEQLSPMKSSIDDSARGLDMDAATNYKRTPGTAGAHPIMQKNYSEQLARTQGELRADCPPGSLSCFREKHSAAFSSTD